MRSGAGAKQQRRQTIAMDVFAARQQATKSPVQSQRGTLVIATGDTARVASRKRRAFAPNGINTNSPTQVILTITTITRFDVDQQQGAAAELS